MPKPKPFAKEVDLCAHFLAHIDHRRSRDAYADEWVPYPETAGWDILLVRKADGFQIGIQAKLRLGTDVINQAIEDRPWFYRGEAGPDCRAVLVPHGDAGSFDRICAYVGLTIIRVFTPETTNQIALRYAKFFEPSLPRLHEDFSEYDEAHWFELAPTMRHPLPEFVPDVTAGAAGPIQLTDWKIKALKIAVTLEKRGFLTRDDFRHLKIDHRLWFDRRWLTLDGRGAWVSPDTPAYFKKQHPRVYDEIAEKYEEWKAPDPLIAPQEEMKL